MTTTSCRLCWTCREDKYFLTHCIKIFICKFMMAFSSERVRERERTDWKDWETSCEQKKHLCKEKNLELVNKVKWRFVRGLRKRREEVFKLWDDPIAFSYLKRGLSCTRIKYQTYFLRSSYKWQIVL